MPWNQINALKFHWIKKCNPSIIYSRMYIETTFWELPELTSQSYPKIKNDMYVDDLTPGVTNVDEVENLKRHQLSILKRGYEFTRMTFKYTLSWKYQ